MTGYIIKKKNRNKKIVQFDFQAEGYAFQPHIKNENFIQVSELYVLDETFIHGIILRHFAKSFRRLAAITYSVVNDEDSTSADAIIALDEVAKQKTLLIRKDKEYLTKKEEEQMVKRLKMLERELKDKLVVLRKTETETFSR